MFLRHLLHAQFRLSKTSVSASAQRTIYRNGLRTGKTSCLSRSDNASTFTNTAPNKAGSERLHDLDITDNIQSRCPSKNIDIVPRQLAQQVGVDEEDFQRILRTGNSTLIEDTIQYYLHYHQPNLSKSIWESLVQDSVLRLLSLPTISAVLSSVQPYAVHLSATAIVRLMRRLIISKQADDTGLLLSLVRPHLIYQLQCLRPANPHSVSYIPPDIIRSGFLFVQAFLSVNYEETITVFQILVHSGHIPSEVIVDSSSSQTLEPIISISLLKASLYWNWNEVTQFILSSLLRSSSASDPFTIRHTTDVLYALLTSPSPRGLDNCLNIIRLLHSHAPVPDSLVRQFYERAADIDATRSAEGLYEFSRNPRVLSTHHYPPPQGRALSKLMFHLTGKSKKVHLVRTLALDVVQGQLPIPLNDRARFISVIGEKGIATSTRALWELYSTGKDGPVVYGDSGLLVQMVSLFTNLAQRSRSKARGREPNGTEKPRMSSTLEYQSFVNQIISKFKEHHKPWENADHRAMTSYARACFIVGENTEGFDIFKVLLERLELPDLYDVNVALSAIAKLSPIAAAKIIRRMEEHGLNPDAVTFGTVLHHATVQKCTQISDEMIERIVQLKTSQSDVQVLGAVIKAVVRPEADDTQETRVLKLKSAWNFVHRFSQGRSQPSTQIGNYLVSLAIQAQDASLAYNFWRTLLKESAEYGDEQQHWQRVGIIALIREQNMRGEISGEDARMIINELKRQKR